MVAPGSACERLRSWRGWASTRARCAPRWIHLVLAWGMRAGLAVWIAGLARRSPVVLGHNDFLPGPVIGALVRAAARSARRVLVPSRAVAADLDPRGHLRERLAVVHPGVRLAEFDLTRAPSTPPEVLVLGALVDWKRPDLALEAVALARASVPQLRLRLVGAPLGPGGEQLRARLRRRASLIDLAGAVELVGGVEDPPAELGRASCLLHCAPREPFGLAVLEALAAGRPAVVPDAAGPREIVDPQCGILYPPGDAAAAAAAIVSLVSAPERARTIGASGRERARTLFSAERAWAQFARAIAPAVRKRRYTVPCSVPPPALVTVTHNSEQALEQLLRSVDRHLSGARLTIVDNASSDGTRAVAARWRRRLRIELLALEENVGFGRACNRGVAEVGDPVTALLNPDVELLDDSLLALAQEAARPQMQERLLAPLVLRADGRRERSAHSLPGSAAELVHALLPSAALGDRAGAALAPWRSTRARPVGWAVGCALVARTGTLRALGPFDESIFLYGEDLDLCLRARERGVSTWFWPAARVLHHGGHATLPAFGGEPFERLARARHEVVGRRCGARTALIDDLAQALTFASRLAYKRALGGDGERERAQLLAARGLRWPRSQRAAAPPAR